MPSAPTDEGATSSATSGSGSFGPNAWLVEELYERYRNDPNSVAESWREFFSDYQRPPARPSGTTETPPAPGAPTVPAAGGPPGASAAAGTTAPAAEEPVALRGAALQIATNMEASLGVPTATSVRTVPARLLEINRGLINDHLQRWTGTRVSFTHLIAFAVLRGLEAVPALNSSYVERGQSGGPGVVHHGHVGLGLAVDVERRDGSRTLMVPVIPAADTLDFGAFLHAYEDVVRRVHAGTITTADLTGATVSLTNPGTVGTVQSVPRLMPGQGVIVGVGAIGWPAGFEGADPEALARIGVGRVLALTSTYDHRIIQGAQSGAFLRHVDQCLRGEHEFYDRIFRELAVPYEPARWHADAPVAPLEGDDEATLKEIRVQKLINMYRVRGHLNAHLDPLEAEPPTLFPELDLAYHGLSIWDLPRTFHCDGLAGRTHATLEEILGILRDAYCRTLGVEYMHIQDPAQKAWIQHHVEGVPWHPSPDEQRRYLDQLGAAEVFERFLHTRYVGQKRFGLEGAESTIVALSSLLDAAAQNGVVDAVLGMAHRGRLNVLANVVGKSYEEIFSEFEGNLDPESVQGSGDVKYHKGAAGTYKSASGDTIGVTMVSNPSHLEAVDPVVEGVARAKQDRVLAPSEGTPPIEPLGKHPVLAILVHGDAAFSGQGVVAETLNLSGLSGYRTGGAVHLVINNQVGFTTAPAAARTSHYPTDVAKMVQSPIFHVNGDDPEACARAMRLAFEFRESFGKDVVVDLVCYRRHGHNEGDDPSYTQPVMYKIIDAKRSVRKLYTEALVRRGDLTIEAAEQALDEFQARLQGVLDEVRERPVPVLRAVPSIEERDDPAAPATGVDADLLRRIAAATMDVPDGFTLHPKLVRQFEARRAAIASGEVDWALGEALAIGSLLEEGTDVRLVGQDTRRGTFSQRHAALVDYENGTEYVPLCHLGAPGRFTVRDSLLSEYAAVGFEYGYSVERPEALTAWEAQFGDFVNGAQIILDNFLVSAEEKWDQLSCLVLLLPHGYEGQGPEHSSGRIERFLSLCARGNLRVVVPSTAAQYFHVLRAQVRRSRPTPLVCFTPKSLLRASVTRSALDELSSGAFAPLVDDRAVADPSPVRRVVLASGKVAHEAAAARDRLVGEGVLDRDAVALIRVEQLYPWPQRELDGVLDRYSGATEVVWLQEEPENMGSWQFAHERLHRLVRGDRALRHVARAAAASPATGSALVSETEQHDLLERALR